MTGSVYITRGIPDEGISKLKECYGTVEINPDDRPLTYDELLEQVKGRDAILTMLSDRIDAQLLNEAKNLKVIANYAVGFDNIDIAAATSHGIVATNTPGVLTEATADMAWALIFAVARRIVEGDRVTRKGEFTGWSPLFLLGNDLVGKTLGIIGSGRIGTAMALRSRGWCMKVLYTSQKNNNTMLEEKLNAKRVALETLLKESDFISLHTPLTEETRHMIGRDEFAIMKRTSYLINTARGAVIDEAAMVDALRNNRIAGAGLDVYEEEPELKPGLSALDNVVLAPHLGSATVETRSRMSIMAAESIIAVLKGQKPENCLNPEVMMKP
ncbi:MAG: D-glycerate dehydrogenase [Planctomycetes bacterium]|nr:D-glycerate dehydrogenase [Planctomycetota bacterium]